MAKSVYLAGPILGMTKGQANDWRNEFKERLEQIGIRGISPLRCEPLIGRKYKAVYDDPRFGSERAIGNKNFMDVQMCDILLMYLPKIAQDQRPSYGTVLELGWGKALVKPAILVSDDPFINKHPVIDFCAGWKLNNLDDAFDVIKGVLGAY